MTKETENQKPVVIAEALIQTASELGQQQDMKLVELIGHMEVAKMEVLTRNIKAAEQLAAQTAVPAEGGDTPAQEASSPDASEDKA